MGNDSSNSPACAHPTKHAALVVGSSDGVVRALSGPVRRHCGCFGSLHQDTVLSIVELLGYRCSEVRLLATVLLVYRHLRLLHILIDMTFVPPILYGCAVGDVVVAVEVGDHKQSICRYTLSAYFLCAVRSFSRRSM